MLKNLLLLSGFSTFAVIVIVGFNIYHSFQLSSLKPTTQVHVVPIPSGFDKKTLEELKKRTPVSVDLNEKSTVFSEDSNRSVTITPSPTITTGQNNSQQNSSSSAEPIIIP